MQRRYLLLCDIKIRIHHHYHVMESNDNQRARRRGGGSSGEQQVLERIFVGVVVAIPPSARGPSASASRSSRPAMMPPLRRYRGKSSNGWHDEGHKRRMKTMTTVIVTTDIVNNLTIAINLTTSRQHRRGGALLDSVTRGLQGDVGLAGEGEDRYRDEPAPGKVLDVARDTDADFPGILMSHIHLNVPLRPARADLCRRRGILRALRSKRQERFGGVGDVVQPPSARSSGAQSPYSFLDLSRPSLPSPRPAFRKRVYFSSLL